MIYLISLSKSRIITFHLLIFVIAGHQIISKSSNLTELLG